METTIDRFLREQMPRRFAAVMEHLRERVRQYDEKVEGGDEGARAKLERYQSRLRHAESAKVEFQIELTGAGGGVYSLCIEAGAMAVEKEPASSPVFGLRQSVEDLRATVDEGVGGRFSLFGDSADGGETRVGTGFARLLAPSFLSQLEAASATIRFEIVDRPSAPDWRLDLGLGEVPSDAPACTIRVREADYEQMASGELLPQQAFFAGKIKIEGDMSVVMRLAGPLMAG